jgi:hypothetical protein
LIGGRGCADAAGKKITEGSRAGEADLHADVGHGKVARRQQALGVVQTRLDPKLVRRDAEQPFKLADEMERRDVDFAGDVLDRELLFWNFCQ